MQRPETRPLQMGSQMQSTMGKLNIFPRRSVWNADGDASTTSAPANTGTTFPVGNKSGCSTCTKKKLACVAAGILIGSVVTYLVTRKGPAKAA